MADGKALVPHYDLRRKYLRILKSLDDLLAEKSINEDLHAALKAETELAYARWREDRKRKTTPRDPGRRRVPTYMRCEYTLGCSNVPPPGHRFCCKAHAPYGRYGLDRSGKEIA